MVRGNYSRPLRRGSPRAAHPSLRFPESGDGRSQRVGVTSVKHGEGRSGGVHDCNQQRAHTTYLGAPRPRAGSRLPAVRARARPRARALGPGVQHPRRRADRGGGTARRDRRLHPPRPHRRAPAGPHRDGLVRRRSPAGRHRLRDRRLRPGQGTHLRLPRRRDLPGLHPRAARPRRPAPPSPLHQLHQLRTAVHHRARDPLRPLDHHDGRLPAVRALHGRIHRPRQPPVPRPADQLPRLRSPAVAADPGHRAARTPGRPR